MSPIVAAAVCLAPGIASLYCGRRHPAVGPGTRVAAAAARQWPQGVAAGRGRSRAAARPRCAATAMTASADDPQAPTATLHYFLGWGRAEPIRWMLAAAGVPFVHGGPRGRGLEGSADFQHLLQNGRLHFGQVPLLTLDGEDLVQTQAILRRLARRGQLVGADERERTMADMMAEGVADLRGGVLGFPFGTPPGRCMDMVARYGPDFERRLEAAAAASGSGGGPWLAGGSSMTYADVLLAETLYEYSCLLPSQLGLPQLRAGGLPRCVDLVECVVALPSIAGYLAGPLRFPPPLGDVGAAYVKNVRETLP